VIFARIVPLLIVVGIPGAGEQQIGQRLDQVLRDRGRQHDRWYLAFERESAFVSVVDVASGSS